MTPEPVRAQAIREIYELLHLAAARGEPVAQPMMAYVGCFVPMSWVESQADCICSAINLEEVATAACHGCQNEWVSGAASRWRNSVKSSYAQRGGTPSHAPRGKPASM